MPGLFGTQASTTSDLNLILQVIVFTVILIGFKYGRTKTAKGLRLHRTLMRSMTVLNLIGVVTVMVPSFILAFNVVANEPVKLGFPLIYVHTSLGAVSVLFGVVLSFRKFGQVRFWMRTAFLVWFTTLFLGFVIYVGYYALGFPR